MSSNITMNTSEQKLAVAVLGQYNLSWTDIVLIQGGSIKTVWRVKTNTGTICLKRLKQTYDKALFSVNAQVYIKNAGGNVPGILTNKKGEAITVYNDQLFVVYEWLQGQDLNFGNPEDLHNAMKGLARFHVFSKGYSPADESRVSTKLGKWPEQYQSMLNKMNSWIEASRAHADQQNYSAYIKYTGQIIDIGKAAIAEIGKSKYEKLTETGSDSIVLCHQDYGKGNALMTGKGVYILDLDGVTYDLPARDLRKIIGKTAENRSSWQPESIRSITGWYEEGNPLNRDERKLLYIDLLFPHWYYGLVKNLFQAGKPVKGSEIERIAKLELSKVPILENLIKKE